MKNKKQILSEEVVRLQKIAGIKQIPEAKNKIEYNDDGDFDHLKPGTIELIISKLGKKPTIESLADFAFNNYDKLVRDVKDRNKWLNYGMSQISQYFGFDEDKFLEIYKKIAKEKTGGKENPKGYYMHHYGPDTNQYEPGFEWLSELPKKYGNWTINIAKDSIGGDDEPIVWYYQGKRNGYRLVYTPNDYYATVMTLYKPGQDMYDSETEGIQLDSKEFGEELDNFSFDEYVKYGAKAIAKAEQMIQQDQAK